MTRAFDVVPSLSGAAPQSGLPWGCVAGPFALGFSGIELALPGATYSVVARALGNSTVVYLSQVSTQWRFSDRAVLDPATTLTPSIYHH